MALPLRFLVLENYDRGLYYPRDMKVYLFFYICFRGLVPGLSLMQAVLSIVFQHVPETRKKMTSWQHWSEAL